MLEPGQVFASRYRVQRRIAEGGMGAIFEAEHTGTERRVALKLLFPHIMSVASAREKFELEAKISARVNSRFIVQVLDAGYDEASKSPYLVMELLDGQTLAARVRELGPFEVDEALRVLGHVAAGLDAAHGYREPGGAAKPIVHRDLKPENLFLARERDGSTVAKILDYGIAKMLGDTSNSSQEVRGTPLYMAYEQVTAEALSPQTDVWAYGLIAHYILTGAHYWRASHRPDTNIQALFAEILSLPLEAPSQRLREHDVPCDLPPGFDAWLLQCIDRTPTHRFTSAGAALDALERVYERGARARSKPAPAPAPAPQPAGTDRTRTFVAAEPAAKSPTVGSYAALASERRSSPARASYLSGASWVYALGIAAVLVLGAGLWLLLGRGSSAPSAAGGTSATSNAASDAVGVNGTKAPGASAAPHAGPTPSGATSAGHAAEESPPDAPHVRVVPSADEALPDPATGAGSPREGDGSGSDPSVPGTNTPLPAGGASAALIPPARTPAASAATTGTAAATNPHANPSSANPARTEPKTTPPIQGDGKAPPVASNAKPAGSVPPAPAAPAKPANARHGADAYKTR